jgi:LAO/AO transport system kinase
MEAIAQHRAFLERTGQRAERERARARMQFLALLRNRLLQSARSTGSRPKGRLDEVASPSPAARPTRTPWRDLARQLST